MLSRRDTNARPSIPKLDLGQIHSFVSDADSSTRSHPVSSMSPISRASSPDADLKASPSRGSPPQSAVIRGASDSSTSLKPYVPDGEENSAAQLEGVTGFSERLSVPSGMGQGQASGFGAESSGRARPSPVRVDWAGGQGEGASGGLNPIFGINSESTLGSARSKGEHSTSKICPNDLKIKF